MDAQHYKGRFAAGIGAGMMLAKTLIIVLGMQLVSYASCSEGAAHRCRFKIVGMALAMALGPIMEVASYAFAPQSLLAPINGFDLVWNVILAPLLLGEKTNRAKIVGTFMVFMGSCIAPISGPHAVTASSLEDLRENFLSVRFMLYAIACMLACLIGFRILRRRRPLRHHAPGRDVVRGTLIGVGGGFLAGQSYFMSASATLLHACMEDGTWGAWLDWLPYATVGGAIGCALLNALLLNKGLAEFEATFFVPMFAGSSISASCISASVVLRETIDLPYWRMACYWFGVLLIVVGLSFLVRDARKSNVASLEPEKAKNKKKIKAESPDDMERNPVTEEDDSVRSPTGRIVMAAVGNYNPYAQTKKSAKGRKIKEGQSENDEDGRTVTKGGIKKGELLAVTYGLMSGT